jgi:cytochrome b-561
MLKDLTSGSIFTAHCLSFQAAGFVAVVLTGVWMGHFRGGFAWTTNPGMQFNLHPLLMVISMVYLYGNGECQRRFRRGEGHNAALYIHGSVLPWIGGPC